MWEQQKRLWLETSLNSYKRRSTDPGKPSLGGFYELETSSQPRLSRRKLRWCTQSARFIAGDRAALEPIAKKALNVSLAKVAEGIH